MSIGHYLTEEKKKALEDELSELKGPKRKETIDALEYAKSLGDLSENAEYHQAREDQAKLESRILKIEEVLRSSIVISGGQGEIIEVGSKVLVQKIGETNEKSYQIVGPEESDMSAGKISNTSPFGQAILGKKEGDAFSFETPAGSVNYKILKVN